MGLISSIFGGDTSSKNETNINTKNDVKTNTNTISGDNNSIENVGGNLTKTDGKAWDLASKVLKYQNEQTNKGRALANKVIDANNKLANKQSETEKSLLLNNALVVGGLVLATYFVMNKGK